jgi:hypothetical protein
MNTANGGSYSFIRVDKLPIGRKLKASAVRRQDGQGDQDVDSGQDALTGCNRSFFRTRFPCSISVLGFRAAFPCSISALGFHTAFPCSITMKRFCAAAFLAVDMNETCQASLLLLSF